MDTLEKLRLELRETLSKASAKAAEWEGKEKEMPPEVLSEIDANIREAEAIKSKIDVLKRKAELDAYANEGVGAKTAVAPAAEEKKDKYPFRSLGEQLVAIIKAGSPAGKVDPRLYEVKTASGLSEGVEGAFLLQPDFVQEIMSHAYDSGQILSRTRKMPTSKQSVKIPLVAETSRVAGSRWGGVQAYWLAEAGEKTVSKPAFENLVLELKKLIGLCYMTDEMMQDLPFLESFIGEVFTEEFTFQLEEAIINGTGGGQPLGILQSPALVTVAKESSQTADTVVYANIVKMWSRLHARSRANAVWLINQDVEPQLYSMTIGTNVPAYLPANGLSGTPYATLFGRPVIPTEHNATLGDVGDVILADFNEYVTIDAGAMKYDTSIHVRFVYDETALRFVYRFDGAPLWKSALTPAKGSNTISPYVTLAARA